MPTTSIRSSILQNELRKRAVIQERSGPFGRGSQRFSLRQVITGSPEYNFAEFAKIAKVAVAAEISRSRRDRVAVAKNSTSSPVDTYPGTI
jgi:hypothetical protein